jgi:hypothetical protein
VQDTPLNWLEDAPAGAGTGSAVQLDPVHFWLTSELELPVVLAPTAMHQLAVHDTPLSVLLVAPGGLAGLATVQAEPFDVSASWNVPLLLVYEPTATQAVEDVQDTPLNWAFVAGLGEFCSVQLAQAGVAVVSAIAVAIAAAAKWRQVIGPRPLTNLVIIVLPLLSVGGITRRSDDKGTAGTRA